jgi:tetratricopeptide (TPR) repeat protein
LLAGLWLGLTARSADGQATESYRELIKQALAEYNAGNWHEAKFFFSQAHAQYPNARTLRGLGLVEFALRDYLEATKLLEQALASQVQPLTGDVHAKVSELLEQSRQFLAILRVEIEPSTAQITLDGHPFPDAPDGHVRLNPGPHELVVSSAGHETLTRRLDLDAGANIELRFKLRELRPDPGPTLPAPVATASAPSAVAPAVASSDSGLRDIAPWILIGAGSAVAITGGVFLGLAAADISAVEDARRPTEWSAVAASYDRAPARSAAGIVLLSVGVIGVAAGLTWKFWPSDEGDPVVLRITPTGVRIGARL